MDNNERMKKIINELNENKILDYLDIIRELVLLHSDFLEEISKHVKFSATNLNSSSVSSQILIDACAESNQRIKSILKKL